jgi:DNA helicase HerA-like ATPase
LQKIKFSGHVCGFGMTGHGKSYSMRKIMLEQGRGIFYFNTQHELLKDQRKHFLDVDASYDLEDIRSALNSGLALNFLPDKNKKRRGVQLASLVEYFLNNRMKEFSFAIEECHLYNGHRDAKDAIDEIFTTGRKWGLWGVALSVRPAIVSNTIISMSEQKFLFYLDEQEMNYFKTYRLPYDDIVQRIKDKGKYSFVIKNQMGLAGAYKV